MLIVAPFESARVHARPPVDEQRSALVAATHSNKHVTACSINVHASTSVNTYVDAVEFLHRSSVGRAHGRLSETIPGRKLCAVSVIAAATCRAESTSATSLPHVNALASGRVLHFSLLSICLSFNSCSCLRSVSPSLDMVFFSSKRRSCISLISKNKNRVSDCKTKHRQRKTGQHCRQSSLSLSLAIKDVATVRNRPRLRSDSHDRQQKHSSRRISRSRDHLSRWHLDVSIDEHVLPDDRCVVLMLSIGQRRVLRGSRALLSTTLQM